MSAATYRDHVPVFAIYPIVMHVATIVDDVRERLFVMLVVPESA